MKLILVVTATVLLPLGMVTAAWADTAPTPQSGAAALQTQAATTAPSETEAERLDRLANRINQTVDRPTGQSEEMPSVNELLNLPQDTVVRGTRGGGLAIGTEF